MQSQYEDSESSAYSTPWLASTNAFDTIACLTRRLLISSEQPVYYQQPMLSNVRQVL